MKIAVASIGKELSFHLDLRFGRAEYFLVVDTLTLEYDVIENLENAGLPHEAGVEAAKNLLGYGIDVLISFNCGPRVFEILTAA